MARSPLADAAPTPPDAARLEPILSPRHLGSEGCSSISPLSSISMGEGKPAASAPADAAAAPASGEPPTQPRGGADEERQRV
jgi:hypothetical protein